MSNASRLWVALLEHTPYTKGCKKATIHDSFVFKKLCLDLAHYYSEKQNRKYHGTQMLDCGPRPSSVFILSAVPGALSEGLYCCYQSDDGNFFRVKVLKFSQPLGLYFPHREKAWVC